MSIIDNRGTNEVHKTELFWDDIAAILCPALDGNGWSVDNHPGIEQMKYHPLLCVVSAVRDGEVLEQVVVWQSQITQQDGSVDPEEIEGQLEYYGEDDVDVIVTNKVDLQQFNDWLDKSVELVNS